MTKTYRDLDPEEALSYLRIIDRNFDVSLSEEELAIDKKPGGPMIMASYSRSSRALTVTAENPFGDRIAALLLG